MPLAGSLKPVKSGGWVMYCDEDLDVRVDGLRAGDEAGLELLDQVGLDAADEADRAGLGLQRGGGADEERALLLGEHQRRHVLQRTSSAKSSGVPWSSTAMASMSANSWSGSPTAAACRCRLPQEADADDEVVAFGDEQPSRRSARSPSLVGVDSVPMAPSSVTAWSRPAAAASLNDLSPRPVMSNSRPTDGFSTAGAAVPSGAVVPSGAWCPRAVVPLGASVPRGGACPVPRWCPRAASVPVGRLAVPSRGGVVAAVVVVIVAARCGGEAERGDEADGKQTLAPDHVLPLLGISVSVTAAGWFTCSRRRSPRNLPCGTAHQPQLRCVSAIDTP